jgi:hypothetical protein
MNSSSSGEYLIFLCFMPMSTFIKRNRSLRYFLRRKHPNNWNELIKKIPDDAMEKFNNDETI